MKGKEKIELKKIDKALRMARKRISYLLEENTETKVSKEVKDERKT